MRKAVIVLLSVACCAALSGPFAELLGSRGPGLLQWDDLVGLLRPFLPRLDVAPHAEQTDLLLLGERGDAAALLALQGTTGSVGAWSGAAPALGVTPASSPIPAAAGGGREGGLPSLAAPPVLPAAGGAVPPATAGAGPPGAAPVSTAAGASPPAALAPGILLAAAPGRAAATAAQTDGQVGQIRGFPGWESLTSFYEAIRGLQEGKKQTVHVVHLGDSEIAGDGVVSTIRKEMAGRFGYGGPGFALAMKAFPSYHRRGWNHPESKGFRVRSYPLKQVPDGAYGPGGVAFDAKSVGAAAEVKLTDEAPEAGCTVSFFYRRQPEGGRLRLLADGQPFAEVDSAADEPGSGLQSSPFAPCPRRLKVEVVGPGRARIFGWSVVHAAPGIVWSSLGVLSARLPHLNNYGEGQLGEALRGLQPDLLVLSYGLNLSSVPQIPGAWYRQGIEQALTRLLAEIPQVACLVVGPYPVGVSLDGQVKASPAAAWISEAQKKAALAHGCGFIDRFNLSGGARATKQWLEHQPKLLSGDLVHLTHVGAARMGRMISLVLWSGCQLHLRRSKTGP
ncbi:MAG: hypothetical protein FJ125_02230 [Deltaproteobacteria bacterium]|nr:hypothetical protein [Deltaproteobacteria bacterium]